MALRKRGPGLRGRFTAAHRATTSALIAAAVVVLGVSGCASDDGSRPRPAAATATSAPAPASGNSGNQQQETASLARIEGQHAMLLDITAAQRDPGGFLTVRATLTNQGSETLEVPAGLRGNEREILRNGQSLGGATLIDYRERKRYYVLRDTEGRPLTTTSVDYLKAGETIRVFMQFPQPPATTTHVGFQLPQFDTATIRIGP
jgi:hypothetical protein